MDVWPLNRPVMKKKIVRVQRNPGGSWFLKGALKKKISIKGELPLLIRLFKWILDHLKVFNYTNLSLASQNCILVISNIRKTELVHKLHSLLQHHSQYMLCYFYVEKCIVEHCTCHSFNSLYTVSSGGIQYIFSLSPVMIQFLTFWTAGTDLYFFILLLADNFIVFHSEIRLMNTVCVLHLARSFLFLDLAWFTVCLKK